MPDLLALALRAIDDADALPVLGDAVLESGWWEPAVVDLMVGESLSGPRNYRRFRRCAANPSPYWARAVYTTLLFAGWAGPRGWPVAERARRPPPTRDEMYAFMRGAWESSGIREMVYRQSPLIGLIQKEIDATSARIARQHSELLYAPQPADIRRVATGECAVTWPLPKESNPDE